VENHAVFKGWYCQPEWAICIYKEDLKEDIILRCEVEEYHNQGVCEVTEVKEVIVPSLLAIVVETIGNQAYDHDAVINVPEIIRVSSQHVSCDDKQKYSHYKGELILQSHCIGGFEISLQELLALLEFSP
jgi:hypothetical protein